MAGPYYVNASTGHDDTGDGSSGNPWKTCGKAASLLAAGETVFGTGTETVASTIAPANSGTVAAGLIKYIACNSSWVPTIGGWVLDGNSGIANIFKPAGKHLIELNGIEAKNATGNGWTCTAAYVYGWRFVDCLVHNNGGSGIDSAAEYANEITVIRGKYYSNSGYGFSNLYSANITGAEIYLNTLGGILCYGASWVTVCDCIIRDNLVLGISGAGIVVYNCIIDNNVIGINVSTYGILGYGDNIPQIRHNVISNNISYGIRAGAAGEFCAEDYNVFYHNGAGPGYGIDRSAVAGALIISGGNSVDTSTDPYIAQSSKNYTRLIGTSLRYADITMPGGIVHREITAGLTPPPNFPTVANVFTAATVDGVTGTGTQPGATDLRKGVQCGIGGTGVTGTLQSTGTLGGHILRRDANG